MTARLTADPVVFSPDGKVIAAMDGPMVRFWDVASGNALTSQLPGGHESRVNSVLFTPDDKTLISAAGDHTIRWWDICTGREQRSLACMNNFPLHWNYPKAILSRNGTLLAIICAEAGEGKDDLEKAVLTEGRSSVHLWDATTGKELYHFDGGDGCSYEVAFAQDGKLLAEVFCDKGFRLNGQWLVRLWDTVSGKRLEHELVGRSPGFSPDSRILITLASGSINFWEVATGKKIPDRHGFWGVRIR